MRYFLLFVLCSGFTFCKRGRSHPVDTDTAISALPGLDTSMKKNILPTSAATYWIYNTMHFDSSGKVEVSDKDSISITRTKTFNGKNFFFIKPFWFRNEDWNTILAYDSVTNTEFKVKNNGQSDSILVKYVAPIAKPYYRHGLKFFLYKSRREINKLDSYKIAVVINNWTGKPYSELVLYFSEGVGIVRAEEYRFDKTRKKYLQTTQEIDHYHIDPANRE